MVEPLCYNSSFAKRIKDIAGVPVFCKRFKTL